MYLENWLELFVGNANCVGCMCMLVQCCWDEMQVISFVHVLSVIFVGAISHLWCSGAVLDV
jgi:hypothetical protein